MKYPSYPTYQTNKFVIKYGHNTPGSQKYQCQHWQRNFTPVPKPEGYAPGVRDGAVTLYLGGMSFRKVAKHVDVHHRHQRYKNDHPTYKDPLRLMFKPLPCTYVLVHEDVYMVYWCACGAVAAGSQRQT